MLVLLLHPVYRLLIILEDGSPNSTQQNPSHTYTNTGTYTINLTAINNFGCTDVITKTVTLLVFNPAVANGGNCL